MNVSLIQNIFRESKNKLNSTAPIAPGSRTSSAFYTHRTRTSTIVVKKNVKMHSVACQLSVK